MKRNLIRFGSAAVLAAGMAFAQSAAPATGQTPTPTAPAKPGMRSFRHNYRERMMQELNLTPEQREKADAIFRKARLNAQPIREEMRRNREAMATAIKANDTAKIRELATERGRLAGQMAAIHSEATAKFYSTLSPGQRAKAEQIHQRFEQRWRERMRTNTRTNG
jgi:Spy/CpxP family protein refolding chaperone